MITCLIRYFNTCCHATSYLFTTSKHIVIGCFRFTSSLCLCLQPCDKRLLLLRLTGTEPKKFVGEGILLLLAQFDILLIFVPLVRLFRFRIEESDEYTNDVSSFDIEDTHDFKTVLLKIRTISKATT